MSSSSLLGVHTLISIPEALGCVLGPDDPILLFGCELHEALCYKGARAEADVGVTLCGL